METCGRYHGDGSRVSHFTPCLRGHNQAKAANHMERTRCQKSQSEEIVLFPFKLLR